VKTWRSRSGLPRLEEPQAVRKAMPYWRSALLGFLVTLGNPKVILFYGALLPTFIDVGSLTVVDTAVMSAVVMTILFLVLGAYAFLAARAGRLVKSSRAVTWLNRITGGLLVGAGIAVATR
jgi:threonine/homoserine/homoserine lactone efflux protein